MATQAYKEASVQGTASISTYATLYDTSATNVTAVVGTLIVCNTGASAATYRIAVMDSAGTPAAADWRFYDCTVPAGDSAMLTVGFAMQNGRYIRVSSSADTVTFSAQINEITG